MLVEDLSKLHLNLAQIVALGLGEAASKKFLQERSHAVEKCGMLQEY